jgi:hypothetical protein
MQALRDEVRTRLSRIETLLQKSQAANPNE